MEYLGSKFIKTEVNSVLTTLGMKPNDKIGSWVHLTLVILFLASLCFGFVKLYRSVFYPENTGPKFSTVASVYLREYPADKNIINLDNVGTLRPFHTFENPDPASQITLARNLTISVLSKLMAPQSNGAAYSYKEEPKNEDLFTFYQTQTKYHKNYHEIEVANRIFLVTLLNIKNLSDDQENPYNINFEYQFGVREK